jgi:hypothetical protein
MGLFVGFAVFGETVPRFWTFFNSAGSMDRFTIPMWLGVDSGVVVFAVVIMALFMFWGAERIECMLKIRRGGGEDA